MRRCAPLCGKSSTNEHVGGGGWHDAGPASPDTVARTREAMRQKVRELQTQPPEYHPRGSDARTRVDCQTPVAQPSADVSDPVRGPFDRSWEN
jgi:hypothetical protein